MGLFRKKPDPISERAKMLTDQIAAIEAEIQRLSDRADNEPPNGTPFAHHQPASKSGNHSSSGNHSNTSNNNNSNSSSNSSPQPRLRSTALPHHQATAASHASISGSALPAPAPQTTSTASPDPVFEEVPQSRWDGSDAPATTEANESAPELGVRRNDAASVWQRFKNHVRGPVTSNPKLVHYLSAGSIQGLRPLRYEKRVARNRVIVLAAFLVLALWGVIAIFISRR